MNHIKHEPHPLDYDWRFTPSTIDHLVCNLAGEGSVGLLGTPSVASVLQTRVPSVRLFDCNPLWRSLAGPTLKVVTIDLCSAMAAAVVSDAVTFDRVLLDPPWYPNHLHNWLAFAENFAGDGCRIWFTLWPEHTRPLAVRERRRILAMLRGRGDVVVYQDAVEYETPQFEQRTKPRDVNRKGDLVMYVPDRIGEVLPLLPMTKEASWRRYAFGTGQVAVKIVGDDGGDIAIGPLRGKRWQLNSVSRRDRDRHLVGIWSSDGATGRVRGASTLIGFLDNLAANPAGPINALPRNIDRFLSPAGETAVWHQEDWR